MQGLWIQLREPRRVELTPVSSTPVAPSEESVDFGDHPMVLRRQNAMAQLSLLQIPLPIGPAPQYFLDYEADDVDDDDSGWESDFTVVDEIESEAPENPIPFFDVPTEVPSDFVCSICRDGGNEGLATHPCSLHHFHFECLKGWYKHHLDCPLCRRVRILT